jgi:ATP-binding cassette subfamily B protein
MSPRRSSSRGRAGLSDLSADDLTEPSLDDLSSEDRPRDGLAPGGPSPGAASSWWRQRGGASPRAAMRARVNFVIGERRGKVVALVVTSFVSAVCESAMIVLVAQIAVALVKQGKGSSFNVAHIPIHASAGTLLWIALGLVLVRLVLQFPLSILPARISAGVQASLRLKLFNAFTGASWAVQSRDREGQLQDTMTTQVIQATGGALQATTLITTLLTFIILLASAFALNPKGAAFVMVASLAMFGLLRPLRAIGVRNARNLSRSQVKYAGAIAESIRVAEETQVFGVAEVQRRRLAHFIETSQALFFRTQLLAKLISNLYQSLIYLLLVGFLAGVYLTGGSHVGSLGAVVLLLVRAGSNGQQVSATYQALSQSMPFIERVQDVAKRYEDSSPTDGEQPLTRVETIAFESVSYAYRPGLPVLSDVSFQMSGCQAIGIIGPSGAGKSTLIQILLQLRTPTEGRYLVNGVPSVEFARADWQRLVSYVPQEPRLLHASVADNIRYFRDLDDDAVERAGRLARIHEDIVSWSEGYETIVGPRADAVSGGQQQRICLARALAARPEVLVLDEPTSALDPHSETLIQDSLTALKDELTLFIIAHRMSTLDICDRVMVIMDGRLVAFDTKALLQEQNTYYRNASMIAAGTSGRTLS